MTSTNTTPALITNTDLTRLNTLADAIANGKYSSFLDTDAVIAERCTDDHIHSILEPISQAPHLVAPILSIRYELRHNEIRDAVQQAVDATITQVLKQASLELGVNAYADQLSSKVDNHDTLLYQNYGNPLFEVKFQKYHLPLKFFRKSFYQIAVLVLIDLLATGVTVTDTPKLKKSQDYDINKTYSLTFYDFFDKVAEQGIDKLIRLNSFDKDDLDELAETLNDDTSYVLAETSPNYDDLFKQIGVNGFVISDFLDKNTDVDFDLLIAIYDQLNFVYILTMRHKLATGYALNRLS